MYIKESKEMTECVKSYHTVHQVTLCNFVTNRSKAVQLGELHFVPSFVHVFVRWVGFFLGGGAYLDLVGIFCSILYIYPSASSSSSSVLEDLHNLPP